MYLNTQIKKEAFRKANDAIMRNSVDAIMRKSINKGVNLENNRIVKIAINQKIPSHIISSYKKKRPINEYLYHSGINRNVPSHFISLYRTKESINDHLCNGIFTNKKMYTSKSCCSVSLTLLCHVTVFVTVWSIGHGIVYRPNV